MKKLPILLLSLGLALGLASGAQAAGQGHVLMICTGEQQGVFNAIGGALSSVLKKEFPGQLVEVANSSGARANCKLVGDEVMDLGLTHGETLHYAVIGDSRGGSPKPLPNIRAIAALYSNYLHVIARKDAGIKSLDGLKGKRIAMGPAGSGTAVTAGVLLEAMGFQRLDLSGIMNQPIADNPQKFRQKRIDAAIVVQGLPSEHTAKCLAAGAVLLPIPEDVFKRMDEINSQYEYESIPKGTYVGQDEDLPTVSIVTLLIANTKMSNDTAYKITKALFDHADVLAAAHPVGKQVSLARAARKLPVPLHPGAEQYYREKGIIK